jgi:hypothetical protein
MFCIEKDDPSTLPCSIKWISEIISFISIILTSIVTFVTAKYTKLNLINQLILQILISEIVDGFDILLVILSDSVGVNTFENFTYRRGICFTQIFLSLFTCLWTLISSFFISFRMFDITVKKGVIFKRPLFKKVNIFSIAIPLFISFWFWVGQTTHQCNQYEEVPLKNYYQTTRDHHHFRHMYCWYEKNVNYVLFVIALLLIAGSAYFSVKGILVMRNIHSKLNDESNYGRTSFLNKKKSNVEYIMKTLWIYPITSGILWFSFFVIQMSIENGANGFGISLVYCIIISTRQLIYSLVFLFTQKDIKSKFVEWILCKTKKKNKSVIISSLEPINDIGTLTTNDQNA